MKAKSKTVRTTRSDAPFAELLEPVTTEKPCGDDLEYDPEFVVLMTKAAPRSAAQYGDFVSEPEAINWADLERDCRRLLLRTRDIRVLVLLLRCRTWLGQAEGLRDGLSILAHLLTQWPDAIHPQLTVDGEVEPALRANALAALADPQGLMQDVRELAISGNTALRLQMRDVERSLGVPRPADALAPESVRQQLVALRGQQCPALAAVEVSAQLVAAIDDWAKANLADNCPDLGPLLRLLDLVSETTATAMPPTTAPPSKYPDAGEAEGEARGAFTSLVTSRHPRELPHNREVALDHIRTAREWFEAHEPSSPVALLLRQAERLTGKRFDEVFQALPSDLVERWARDDA